MQTTASVITEDLKKKNAKTTSQKSQQIANRILIARDYSIVKNIETHRIKKDPPC